jgi:hypothetical protein
MARYKVFLGAPPSSIELFEQQDHLEWQIAGGQLESTPDVSDEEEKAGDLYANTIFGRHNSRNESKSWDLPSGSLPGPYSLLLDFFYHVMADYNFQIRLHLSYRVSLLEHLPTLPWSTLAHRQRVHHRGRPKEQNSRVLGFQGEVPYASIRSLALVSAIFRLCHPSCREHRVALRRQ